MSIYLSSACRCGPKGISVHEMGRCPELYRGKYAARKPLREITVSTRSDNLRSSSVSVPNDDILKPPWKR